MTSTVKEFLAKKDQKEDEENIIRTKYENEKDTDDYKVNDNDNYDSLVFNDDDNDDDTETK